MDADALSHIPKGEYNQHIEADSVCALISQAVQSTTLMEAYSCNVWVTETLDMQKDPKAMLAKYWVITQNKEPAIREIKYLINSKWLKGRKVYSQGLQIKKQYLRQCSHLVLCGWSYTDGLPCQRKTEMHYSWCSLKTIKRKLCKDVMMTLDIWELSKCWICSRTDFIGQGWPRMQSFTLQNVSNAFNSKVNHKGQKCRIFKLPTHYS